MAFATCLQTAENAKLEEKIKWADAFILLYSVTDENSLPALVGKYNYIGSYSLINCIELSRGQRASSINCCLSGLNREFYHVGQMRS